jgi:prefoldin subunit 5
MMTPMPRLEINLHSPNRLSLNIHQNALQAVRDLLELLNQNQGKKDPQIECKKDVFVPYKIQNKTEFVIRCKKLGANVRIYSLICLIFNEGQVAAQRR